MGLQNLDISQNQAALGQLAQVNAQNAAQAEARKQRRNQMLMTAAGIGLGAVAGPAAGLTALQGASLGASALPALAQGNYPAVAQSGLQAGALSQANAQQAQRAAAVGDIQSGLEGLKVQPALVPGSQLGGQPQPIISDNPDVIAGQALGLLPTETSPSRPDATVAGQYAPLGPQDQRLNSYLSALQGITPIAPEKGLDLLGKFALPQDRTARFLKGDEISALRAEGVPLPENAIVARQANGNYQITFPRADSETSLEERMRVLRENNPDLPERIIAGMATGTYRIEVPAQGGTAQVIDVANRVAYPVRVPPVKETVTIPDAELLQKDPNEMSDAELDRVLQLRGR